MFQGSVIIPKESTVHARAMEGFFQLLLLGQIKPIFHLDTEMQISSLPNRGFQSTEALKQFRRLLKNFLIIEKGVSVSIHKRKAFFF